MFLCPSRFSFIVLLETFPYIICTPCIPTLARSTFNNIGIPDNARISNGIHNDKNDNTMRQVSQSLTKKKKDNV